MTTIPLKPFFDVEIYVVQIKCALNRFQTLPAFFLSICKCVELFATVKRVSFQFQVNTKKEKCETSCSSQLR